MQRNGQLIEIGKGCFKIIPKPRGGDWLETDLQHLKSEGFTFVVSLLTGPEILELDLVNEESLCKALQLEFYSYPIIDRATPRDRTTFEDFAIQILSNLNNGGRGVFHCRAGLGRAPLLGCTVMVQAGGSG